MANARSSPGKISLIQQFLNDFVGETMVASPTLECFQAPESKPRKPYFKTESRRR
jgi:hypothetical protein